MIQTVVLLSLRLLMFELVPENLEMDRDPFRGSTEELVGTHGIRRIPAPWGFDVFLAVALGTPVHKRAIRVSHLLRDTLFLQSHLKAVVRHGAVLASKKLQDHVSSPRIDTRHPAASAKLGDLEDLSVHVFQKHEIIATAARDVSRRSIIPEIFACRRLNKISKSKNKIL